MKLSIIIERHVYLYYPYVKQCPRHKALSQVNTLEEATIFENLDLAIDALLVNREPLDRYHFWYTDGTKLIQLAFRTEYEI